MSTRKDSIRFLRAAEDDLTEIITFIAAENQTAAEHLAAKIEKSISLLARDPYLGRIPDDEHLFGLGYRYLVVVHYLIFYTVEENTVFIHRIIQGARDYGEVLI